MFRTVLLFTLTLFVFTGCAHYPMGLTEDEWLTLSSDKQVELRIQQSEIDERRYLQREKQRAIEEQRQLEQERTENARIESLYNNANYQDIITVNLYEGTYQDHDSAMRIQPISITLVRGEQKEVDVLLRHKNGYNYEGTIIISFDKRGNEIFLGTNDNEGIKLLNNGRWHRERVYQRTYHYSKNKQLRNLKIGVRYNELYN